MKRNTIKDKRKKEIIVIISITALIIFFVSVMLFQKNYTTGVKTGTDKDPQTRSGIFSSKESKKEFSGGNNRSDNIGVPTPPSNNPTIIKEGRDKMDKETSAAGQEDDAIFCSSDVGLFCEVYEEDKVISLLEKNPFVDGVLIGEKNLNKVSKIKHQLTFVSQTRNVIAGFGGEVLTSSGVVYEDNKKLLTIYIAIDRRYYQSLGLSEKRTAYKSQLVRELFDLTGSSPTNYPKLQSVISKLAWWNPK